MKYITIAILFIISLNSVSQNSSVLYFKDIKLKKSTSEKKGRYKTIISIKGPITEKETWDIRKNKILNSFSFKTNDSLNYWRSIVYRDQTKTIKYQHDSLLEITSYDLNTDTLVGKVIYKNKLSNKDQLYLDSIKVNKKFVYSEKEITPPIFYNQDFSFLRFLAEIVQLKDHDNIVFSGNDIIEGIPYSIYIPFKVTIDTAGYPTQVVILNGFEQHIDMKLYKGILKSPKWTSPAMKENSPVNYSVYQLFREVHYPPIFIKDTR